MLAVRRQNTLEGVEGDFKTTFAAQVKGLDPEQVMDP